MDFLIFGSNNNHRQCFGCECVYEHCSLSTWVEHVLLLNLSKQFTIYATAAVTDLTAAAAAAAATSTVIVLSSLLNLCYIICSLKRKMLVCMWRIIELRAHHTMLKNDITRQCVWISFFLFFSLRFTISEKDYIYVCAESTLNVPHPPPHPPFRFI